jgi:hypothetical protein
MARISRPARHSYRSRQRRFAKSARFPRSITVAFILIMGLILWLGVLADPSGHLRRPGVGSILYLAGVIGVTAFLAYADRNGSSGRSRKYGPGYKGRRHATAK